MSLERNLYAKSQDPYKDVYDMPVPTDLNFAGSAFPDEGTYPPETGVGPNPNPVPPSYEPDYPPDTTDPGNGPNPIDPGDDPDPGTGDPDNPNPDNPDPGTGDDPDPNNPGGDNPNPGTGGDDPNNPGNDDPDDPNHGTGDPNNPDPGNDDPDPNENPNDNPDPEEGTVFCDVKFIPQVVYFESDNTIHGAALVGRDNIDNGPFYYLSDSTTYVYDNGEKRVYGTGRPGIAVAVKSTEDVKYFKVYIDGNDTGVFLEANPLIDNGLASVAWDLTGNIFAVDASALTVEYNVSIVEVDISMNEVQGGLYQMFQVSLMQDLDIYNAVRSCFVPISGTADAHGLWAGTVQWDKFD